jgi:uncharacterized damage-inducible protein DinB
MTEHQLSLAPFYAGWDVYQQHLVAAIAPLTSEQLALRSSPQQWSVGMLTTHIISARAWWFHTRMSEGNADLAPLGKWDEHFGEDGHNEEPSRPAAELVAGLERTWQMIQDALAHLTPADLEQVFPHPDGGDRPARSRQWIIWHVLEHDIHHGGELSSILGAHGLAAVDLE